MSKRIVYSAISRYNKRGNGRIRYRTRNGIIYISNKDFSVENEKIIGIIIGNTLYATFYEPNTPYYYIIEYIKKHRKNTYAVIDCENTVFKEMLYSDL